MSWRGAMLWGLVRTAMLSGLKAGTQRRACPWLPASGRLPTCAVWSLGYGRSSTRMQPSSLFLNSL